jgi:hypothetical protein
MLTIACEKKELEAFMAIEREICEKDAKRCRLWNRGLYSIGTIEGETCGFVECGEMSHLTRVIDPGQCGALSNPCRNR